MDYSLVSTAILLHTVRSGVRNGSCISALQQSAHPACARPNSALGRMHGTAGKASVASVGFLQRQDHPELTAASRSIYLPAFETRARFVRLSKPQTARNAGRCLHFAGLPERTRCST